MIASRAMPTACNSVIILIFTLRLAAAQDLKFIEKLLAEGHVTEAEVAARELLRTCEGEKGPDSFESGQAIDLLVKVLHSSGKAAETETLTLAERAVRIKESTRGPQSRQTATSLINLAALGIESGNYAAAMPALERARSILENSGRSGDVTLQACLSAQAALLQATGKLEDARGLFARVLVERELTFGPDHPAVAWSLNNLAMCLVDMNAAPDALPLEKRALEIWQIKSPDDTATLGTGLNNLGWISYLVGSTAEAASLLERSLVLREASLGPEHPHVAATLENLALSLDVSQDSEAQAKALTFHQRALDLRKKSLGADHPLVARSHRSLAEAQARNGKSREALDHALLGEEIWREHVRSMALTMVEEDSLLYREARRLVSARTSGLDVALSVLPGLPDAGSLQRVFDNVIRSRALVLDAMASRQRGLGDLASREPQETACRAELREAAMRLSNVRVRGPRDEAPDAYRRLLESLRAKYHSAERALAAKSVRFREKVQQAPIGFAEVLASLAAGSALVSYVRQGDGRYTAFVLRSGEKSAQALHLGRGAEIDELAKAWIDEASRGVLDSRRSQADAELQCRRRGAALKRLVWDPIAAHLGGVGLTFLVLDGELELVSFAALPSGESGYLVETGPELVRLSAERNLIKGRIAQSSGKGFLAVGGAAFDAPHAKPTNNEPRPVEIASAGQFRAIARDCLEFRSTRFEERPAMLAEALEAARLWEARSDITDRALVLTGDIATEAAFKVLAPGRRILHLATHAFFLGGSCAEPARGTRGITRLKQASTATSAAGDEGLLHLSGLALAGANQRGAVSLDDEDGILTAEEVVALDLSSAELVVLSACDTGVGRVAAGEGVLGLRRAFQVAGAHAIVTTLWPVDDEAARAWMGSFYAAFFARNLGPAESVGEASREVLRSRRARGESTHPFYWAAFVATRR